MPDKGQAFSFRAMQRGSRCGFSAPVKNEDCAITTDAYIRLVQEIKGLLLWQPLD